MSTTELVVPDLGPSADVPAAPVERGATRPGLLVAAGLGVGVLLLSTIALGMGDGEKSAATPAIASTTALGTGEAPVQAVIAGAGPATGAKCRLLTEETEVGLSGEAARTLTMITAVGMQVGAPLESSARVLDMAGNRSGFAPRVTDALQLFAKGDTKAPTGASLGTVRALGKAHALSCTHTMPMAKDESRGTNGLTPRADTLRKAVIDAFGGRKITGYGKDVTRKDEALPRGRAMLVKISPADLTERGWTMAHWMTAHAATYRIGSIGYDGWAWTNRDGWRPSASANASAPGQLYVAVINGTSPQPATKVSRPAKKSAKKSR
ncbi:MAG: hypothetical protein ACT4PP_12820 [Sporichthyaceae bacterium]